MTDSVRVTLVSYADFGGGAHRATERIFSALQTSSDEKALTLKLTVVRGSKKTDNEKGGYPKKHARSLPIRLFSLFSRRLWKKAYAVAGGQTLYSKAMVKTGLIGQINQSATDIVVANWFGDYTDSIEELGQLKAYLVLRNGDMWWFQGSRHFANAPGFSGSRWQNLLEKVFFAGEEQKTLERKRQHLYPRVSATVSPSPWMTQQADRSGLMPKALHVTIPNPIDTSVWFAEDPGQARSKMGIAVHERSIGFGAIGGMRDPRKGGDLLLQALEILGSDNRLTRNIRCDVFGQKAQSKQLGELPFVSHGTLNDVELRSFYSSIDVLVVPSRMEGFPNTALEALACGTPVVAFDTGPMSDYLVHGETALLAEAFSPEDLAKQLESALDDPEWRERAGTLGRGWVDECLSPEVVASQWKALFHRLLDSSGGQ